METLEHIGDVSVDSGVCWIGDAVSVLDSKSVLPTWNVFVERLLHHMKNQVIPLDDITHDGIAVRACYGDGTYPVFAHRLFDGRIDKVEILFDVR